MTKPAIPPGRGTLHKASSEGCNMWAPVVQPVRKSNPAAHPVGTVMNEAPRLVDSGSDAESAATVAGVNP